MLRKGFRFLRTSCTHTHSSLCLIGKRRRRGAADSPPPTSLDFFQRSVDTLFFVPLLFVAYVTLLLIQPPNNTPFVVVLGNILKDRGTRPWIRKCGFNTWKWPYAGHFHDTLKHFMFPSFPSLIWEWGQQHSPSTSSAQTALHPQSCYADPLVHGHMLGVQYVKSTLPGRNYKRRLWSII